MDIHVYILRCADSSFYTGIARAGLDKRIGEHNEGVYRGYTHSRRPVKLVWSQDFLRLTDAIACERRIKGWRREKKLALIRGDYALLPALAKTAKTPHASSPSTSSG